MMSIEQTNVQYRESSEAARKPQDMQQIRNHTTLYSTDHRDGIQVSHELEPW